MYVFLDSNVYISEKYNFNDGSMSQLATLIKCGNVRLLYTSITVGEVKDHIKIDVSNAVKEYNKVLRTYPKLLVYNKNTKMQYVKEEDIIEKIIDDFDEFLSLENIEKISINPIDAEDLMVNYFNKNLPFENSKPDEFKDAMMINSLKEFQKKCGENIVIVSSDEGFCRALENQNGFQLYKKLFELINAENLKDELLSELSDSLIDDLNDLGLDDILIDFFANNEFVFAHHTECEITASEFHPDPCFLENIYQSENKHIALLSCEVTAELDITYLDEENSFFDKKESRFLIKNFIKASETHQFYFEFEVSLDINWTDIEVNDFAFVNTSFYSSIELDESTLIDSYIEKPE